MPLRPATSRRDSDRRVVEVVRDGTLAIARQDDTTPRGQPIYPRCCPLSSLYEAIPIIVPILFVIGIVGALVYERAQRGSEKPAK